jgi:hypothetical protein
MIPAFLRKIIGRFEGRSTPDRPDKSKRMDCINSRFREKPRKIFDMVTVRGCKAVGRIEDIRCFKVTAVL